MDQHCFDLDAYLARISNSGPRAVSLTLLRELVAHHSAAIAFGNIDPLARRMHATGSRIGAAQAGDAAAPRILLGTEHAVPGRAARAGLPGHRPDGACPAWRAATHHDAAQPHAAAGRSSGGTASGHVGNGALNADRAAQAARRYGAATPDEVFRLGLIDDEFTLQARDRRRLGGYLSVRAVAAVTDRLRGDQLAHGDAAQCTVRGEPRRDPAETR